LKEGQVYVEGTPTDVLTVQNIRDVYRAEVYVYPHPVNKLPATLVIGRGNHVRQREKEDARR